MTTGGEGASGRFRGQVAVGGQCPGLQHSPRISRTLRGRARQRPRTSSRAQQAGPGLRMAAAALRAGLGQQLRVWPRPAPVTCTAGPAHPSPTIPADSASEALGDSRLRRPVSESTFAESCAQSRGGGGGGGLPGVGLGSREAADAGSEGEPLSAGTPPPRPSPPPSSPQPLAMLGTSGSRTVSRRRGSLSGPQDPGLAASWGRGGVDFAPSCATWAGLGGGAALVLPAGRGRQDLSRGSAHPELIRSL